MKHFAHTLRLKDGPARIARYRIGGRRRGSRSVGGRLLTESAPQPLREAAGCGGTQRALETICEC